jgi:hypothetical protein
MYCRESYTICGLPCITFVLKACLQVMWTDIDYMYRFRDFTFDVERFNVQKLRSFVDRSVHPASVVDLTAAISTMSKV